MWKLIVSPEDWDGDFWESPDANADEGEWNSNETIEPPPPREEEVPDLKFRQVIKTKVSKPPQGGQWRNTDRTMAWDPLQLANLQEENQGSQKLSICAEWVSLGNLEDCWMELKVRDTGGQESY